MRRLFSISSYSFKLAVSAAALAATFGALAGPVPTGKPAHYPDWWFERDVIARLPAHATNSTPVWPDHYPLADDYAAVNKGQLKHIAKQAYEELVAKLPSGAGPVLDAAWLSPLVGTDDYNAINLGQLKTVAAPFYDRLIAEGLANSYPWQGGGTADDYALANLGQLKFTFSLKLDATSAPSLSMLISQYIIDAEGASEGDSPLFFASSSPPPILTAQSPQPGGAPAQLPSYLPGADAGPGVAANPMSFNIRALNDAIQANWHSLPGYVSGHEYALEKRTDYGEWSELYRGTLLKFSDSNLRTGRLYEYRLSEIDQNGNLIVCAPILSYDVPLLKNNYSGPPANWNGVSGSVDRHMSFWGPGDDSTEFNSGNRPEDVVYVFSDAVFIGLDSGDYAFYKKAFLGGETFTLDYDDFQLEITNVSGYFAGGAAPHVIDDTPYFVLYRGTYISAYSIPADGLLVEPGEIVSIVTNYYFPFRGINAPYSHDDDGSLHIDYEGGMKFGFFDEPSGAYFNWSAQSLDALHGASPGAVNSELFLRITPRGDETSAVVNITSASNYVINSHVKPLRLRFDNPRASSPASIPLSESSGAKYRKIALNGAPLTDGKPQQSEESDQAREETFIDALTLGLRHDTTDIYHTVPGSDLFLGVRRSVTPEVWNQRRGVRPNERPDRPFGAGWTSNLAAGIEFSRAVGSASPTLESPDTATVTDENGARYTFAILYGSGTVYNTQNGYVGSMTFVPLPSSWHEQDAFLCTLVQVGNNYVFTRKFGTVCTYQAISLAQTVAADRIDGSSAGRKTTYARLTRVRDRLGNQLDYDYSSVFTLIPATISTPAGAKIDIRQNENGLVTDVWDSNGYRTKYDYVAHGDTWRLNWVETPRADNQTDGPRTHYTYTIRIEPDLSPVGVDPHHQPKFHHALESITDPLNQTYSFDYAFDHAKRDLFAGQYYTKTGLPLVVTKVTLPDGTEARFDNSTSLVRLRPNPLTGMLEFDPQGRRITRVTDAKNNERVYQFTNTQVQSMPSFASIYAEGGPSFDAPRMIFYTKMTITSYVGAGTTAVELGKEEFTFKPEAGMALASVKDFSGNTTTYAYLDPFANNWSGATGLTGAAFGRYSDPTSQTNAIGGTKFFTYGAKRIMTSQTDENGVKTQWTLDSLARRTEEHVYPANSTTAISWTKFDYTSTAFPGFMTKKTVKKLATTPAEPTWVVDLVTQYIPDSNGRLWKEIIDPGGLALTTVHTYDAGGNKLTTTDPRNHTTTFSYDRRHRLTHVTYADATQRRLFYDARGNKIREEDENGHSTLWTYDALNRVVHQAVDMNGNHQIDGLSLDGTGTPDRAIDLVTTFTYDELNARLTTTDPRGTVTKFTYDTLSRLVTKTDDFGGLNYTTTYRYDGVLSGLPSVPPEYSAYEANRGGSSFDGSSFKPRLVIDPRGYRTRVIYDPLGRAVFEQVEYTKTPASAYAATRKTYDPVGNLTHLTAPAATGQTTGTVTLTDYDALRRPWRVTEAHGTPLSATTTNHYTTTGLLFRRVDALSNDMLTTYDPAGRPRYAYGPLVKDSRLALTAPPERPVTETIYDDAGNVSAIINPLGRRTDYGYDARNRRVTETLPVAHDATSVPGSAPVRALRTTVYDLAGRPVAVQDPRGAVTITRYDAAGRVREIESPGVLASDGVTIVYPLVKILPDANGNALEVTDANGHLIRNRYDALNRLLETRQYLDPAATTADTTFSLLTSDLRLISTRYAYDSAGNRLDVWDGKNQRTRFTYDGLNRNTTITDPADRAVTFDYDALNKTARVDSENRRTEYDYDSRHRLEHVRYIGRSADNRDYTYDDLSRILFVTEPGKTAANVAYTYDALGRIETETSHGRTHAYRYDPANNRTHVTYNSTGTQLVSQYDDLNRLEALSEYPGGAGPARTTTYGYDLAGNIVEKQLPNANLETTRYDGLNRRITTTVTRPGGSLVLALLQRYDPAGNVVQIREEQPGLAPPTVINTYDDANRLHVETITQGGTATATTYLFDQANNRTDKIVATNTGSGMTLVETTYAYNNLNQLVGSQLAGAPVPATTYTYDHNGNRSTVVRQLAGVSTDTYTYDYENRLVSLTVGSQIAGAPGSPTVTPGTYAYVYDYRTRRVQRVENAATTSLVFSGGVSVAEYQGGTTSVSSALSAEYIRGSDWGGGVGGLLYSVRSGVPSYKHYNSRGDVVAATNAAGTATWQGAYEAFGTRTQEVGTTQDRQKANTKEEDPTGLLNEGFRYRCLETGVFITRDPLGFVDGPNMYAYVVQNPWSYFDPLGLKYKYDYKEDKEGDSDETKKSNTEYNQKLKVVESAHDQVRKSKYYAGSVVEKIDKDEKNTVVVRVGEDDANGSHHRSNEAKKDADGNYTTYIYVSMAPAHYISDDGNMRDMHDTFASFKYNPTTVAADFVHESVHASDLMYHNKDFETWRRNDSLPGELRLSYPNKLEWRAVHETNKYLTGMGMPTRTRYATPGQVNAMVAELDPDRATRQAAEMRADGYLLQALKKADEAKKNNQER
jgi:RHS repeat-associated protein